MSKPTEDPSTVLKAALDSFFHDTSLPETLAIAVSGGADSLALAHACAKAYPDTIVHILTVDHGLRKDSAAEAAHVKALVGAWGANCHAVILGGAMDFQGTRLQEGARRYRYDLMRDYCERENISLLLTAHHGDDQLETFLIRLCAGSAPSGLKGMQSVSHLTPEIRLGRPLLRLSHADCVAYCHEKAIKWVEDPSNQNSDFQRVRMRKMTDFLQSEGLDIARLITLGTRLADLDDLLREAVKAAHNSAVLENTSIRIVYDFEIYKNLNRAVATQLLDTALDALGHPKTYGPRLHKVENLVDDLRSGAMIKARTLNGCCITPDSKRNRLEITPENM